MLPLTTFGTCLHPIFSIYAPNVGGGTRGLSQQGQRLAEGGALDTVGGTHSPKLRKTLRNYSESLDVVDVYTS